MKRRGRHRKDGSRYPSGELHKLRRESVREIAATMPHRRGLGDEAVSTWAETPLGRLYLLQQITLEQAHAGEEFARRWHRYLATIDGPRLAAGGDAKRPFDCDGCSGPDVSVCACIIRLQEYCAACAELPHATRSFVTRIIIGLEQCRED